jgi:type IV pilus assembly protein PilY1
MRLTRIGYRLQGLAAAALLSLASMQSAQAAPLNIVDAPLFLDISSAPLNLLVVGRDHKLYYEAYNDRSDLNGDGELDVGYKGWVVKTTPLRPGESPFLIDYYGYFDSFKCYAYDPSTGVFTPQYVTSDKTCGGEWSGDYLNYLTTARIDALRKVLYGGSRYVDSTTSTVLQRTHIPQEGHSWGKEYESVARDGYDIKFYTPYVEPLPGTRHLFANTTLLNDVSQLPRLRVLQNQPYRIWEWVSIERPVAGDRVLHGGSGPLVGAFIQDHIVRVAVCVSNALKEENCRAYPGGTLKPIGLIQEYGENDAMLFGLLTGSYMKNTQGGVLRDRVGPLMNTASTDQEINPSTGQFTSVVGTIRTLDRLRTVGFGGSFEYNASCGWITTRPINSGECRMWGNPIAEMMYEGLRYFAGRSAPTAAFATTGGDDGALGLPTPAWDNPYAAASRACAKPFMTVVSDINPSYDTDQLPGSKWGGITGDLPGLNVRTIGNAMWTAEYGGPATHFIGEAGTTSNGAPTPKVVTGFGEIRGLAPEEPTKNGGYYAGSVAYYGYRSDLNSATGRQSVQTFAVAVASPLPRIEIPTARGTVTLVPFAKSVGGCLGVSPTPPPGGFQPTNTIVDFYVDTITPTYGRFRINFEDVEQGADHDMDAIAIYEYTVNADDTVTVSLTSEYAAGCIIQHMGYIISGTTSDGIYLEIRDRDTPAGSDVNYFLDTPNDPGALPLAATRTFAPGSTGGATLLKDPLWYAAKWGGFRNDDGDWIPNDPSEWDENGDGNPDNYFLVTNALTLSDQLRAAFDEIQERVGSAASASVNSGSINSETRVFQAKFNSSDWSGELLSYSVDEEDRDVTTALQWNAKDLIPPPDSREILTVDDTGEGVAFRWDDIGTTRQAQLQPSDLLGEQRLDWLRGDRTLEQQTGATGAVYRDRSTVLGDIINSSPAFVGKPSFLYRDSLESAPYSAFREANRDREGVVYVGANDGMLHAFDSATGRELFAYVPGEVFDDLHRLTAPGYTHRYYVDGSPTAGDAFIDGAWHTVLVAGLNKGGQGVFALDVTDPDSIRETNASSTVLWEFSDDDDADLGYTFSRPAIVRLHNGRWGAVFGNGYNNTVPDGSVSSTGNAVLYVVDLEDGTLVRKIDTGVGVSASYSGGRPNGLATPAIVDINGDQIADFAYVGDLFGNLWKFDLTSSNPSDWDSAYEASGTPVPLFVARDSGAVRQPITVRPEVTRGPDGQGLMVLFGTGKYLEPADELIASLRPQTFYGILDNNSGTVLGDVVVGRSVLREQRISDEIYGVEFTDPDGNTLEYNLRGTTKEALGTARGWYIDLVSPARGFEGEMQVTDSVVRNGRVIFTTLIPNPNVCEYGGTSWLMELDVLTGGRLDNSPFDLNDDGEFNSDDFMELADGSRVPASGLQTSVGITPKPAVLAGESAEYKFMPGTSGEMQVVRENPGASDLRRQSWRQLR